MSSENSKRYDVVPTHLAVQAMRDNGYRNAAYAIAELIDNSIQAKASQVELLCLEREETVGVRIRRRINAIAVLDNGTGMDAATLRIALQFGNGTYLKDRSGIGRFGMGLPSASISQCKRVDVWSWTEGPDKPLYTYLDLGEIEREEMLEIPEPVMHEIPKLWRSAAEAFGASGTLVVWSNLDRCMWRTGGAIIRNSEEVIGRMYRRFLDAGTVTIRMATLLEDDPKDADERFARPNDPGYLMSDTSCPEPYDRTPMFETWGEKPVVYKIGYNGKEHDVTISFSLAKKESRRGHNPGALPYGRHAARNVGVSLVRAGRELELAQSWVNQYDPTERWWGVKIEFSPELDELFGVSNNKQDARFLSEAGNIDVDMLLEAEGKSMQELMDEFLVEEDPTGPLLGISQKIHSNLHLIRALLKTHRINTGRKRRHEDPNSPEAIGTMVTRERQQEGYPGESDKDEQLPADKRKQLIFDELIEQQLPKEEATQMAATTVDTGLKYVFHEAELETQAFFSVKPKGGTLIITLNTIHPAYAHLLDALETQEDIELTEDDLRERFIRAWRGLRLLLEAWARYEDEQPPGLRREAVQDARSDWGRVARDFLKDSE